jgi:hypothetical protein
MADITFLRSQNLLDAYGKQIPVSNFVRLSHDASGNDVVLRTSYGNVPYKPQGFPVSPPGGWKVLEVKPETKQDLAPFFVATDAWQMVEEWLLTSDGKYDKPSGRMVMDNAYGIHFSVFTYTYGCIRVIYRTDLEWLVGQIQAELAELKAEKPDQSYITLEAA